MENKWKLLYGLGLRGFRVQGSGVVYAMSCCLCYFLFPGLCSSYRRYIGCCERIDERATARQKSSVYALLMFWP